MREAKEGRRGGGVKRRFSKAQMAKDWLETTRRMLVDTRFDEAGHAEPWRNEVAKDLNLLMETAAFLRRVARLGNDCEANQVVPAALMRTVVRVAEFDDICEASTKVSEVAA